MLAKLSADILDKLDIFILEIEELRIPQVCQETFIVGWNLHSKLFTYTKHNIQISQINLLLHRTVI